MRVSIPGAAGTLVGKGQEQPWACVARVLVEPKSAGEPTRLVLEKQNNVTYAEEYTAPKAALATQVCAAHARLRLHPPG